MPLDNDTLRFLDEVKKGKPRRFAMIMKGEKILSLQVYKRGSLEKYKKQAKEQGKGQFYFGVINGKGQSIVFNLCRQDGFEKEPGKEVKLKAFLKQEGDLQFKPTYQIVDELPAITDGGDEAAADAPATHEQEAREQPATDGGADQANQQLAEKLNLAVNKLTPLIKSAIAANPERKAEILQPAVEIKGALADGRLQEAKEQLLDYGPFLKSAAAAIPAASTPISAEAPDGNADQDGMAVWQTARQVAVERLKEFAKAMAATGSPLAKPAIIEVQSIIKNLTVAPSDPRQVAELDRYLRDDDVITAAEEAPPEFVGPIQLREPLLTALAALPKS